jgi:hypothetical protein
LFPEWRVPERNPILPAALAVLAAMLMLQLPALERAEARRTAALQDLLQQQADAAAGEIQQEFHAPVGRVLSALDHSSLCAGRTDQAVEEFVGGLNRFPHLERFFLWLDSAGTTGRPALHSVERGHGTQTRYTTARRDPGSSANFSRFVRTLADEYALSPQPYVATERNVERRRYHIVIRLFRDARAPERCFALAGFLVDREALRAPLLQRLVAHRHDRVVPVGSIVGEFNLRVVDETSQALLGSFDPHQVAEARASFPLRFYPAHDSDSPVADDIPARKWTALVSTKRPRATRAAPAGEAQPPWRSVASIGLVATAVGLLVHNRSRFGRRH